MANSLIGLLFQKADEWITGRKIGITIGVDPNANDGERGGDFWGIPISRIDGTKEIKISEYPMEYGKVYNDNMVFMPEVIVMQCCLSNGIISETISNALLTAQQRLGKDWLPNTVLGGMEKIDTMTQGNILCDITTRIKTYKNLHLIKRPIIEDYENDQNHINLTLYFREVQLFKPDTLKLSAPVKKTASAIRKNKVKKNVPKKTKQDSRYYKIMPDGSYCTCKF